MIGHIRGSDLITMVRTCLLDCMSSWYFDGRVAMLTKLLVLLRHKSSQQ